MTPQWAIGSVSYTHLDVYKRQPQEDMGYDIANYEKVWPRYGTNEDCFQMIEEAHKRGISVSYTHLDVYKRQWYK